MSRISNSKKYNDMCNHYESIISELQSELCMLQQAYNEVMLKLEQQEDEVSQIETGKDGVNDDRTKNTKETS